MRQNPGPQTDLPRQDEDTAHPLSMARIRSHAAVSNGSLFHFFPRKADLAAGVLVEGMRDCQDAVLAALDTTAEHGVRVGVRALLAWVDKHAEMARFVFTDAPDDVLLAAEPTLAAHNRRYVHHIAAWLTGSPPPTPPTNCPQRRGERWTDGERARRVCALPPLQPVPGADRAALRSRPRPVPGGFAHR
jgi:AcrR family transcriptional regulator